MENDTQQRWDMVNSQIRARGVRSEKVLSAMRLIPRHAFLPAHLRVDAYEDRPIPIADGLTLIQPYVVAYMIEALGLKGGEKVLEIGAGTGYVAAVLAAIAGQGLNLWRAEEETWVVGHFGEGRWKGSSLPDHLKS
jgi:protein-L-isoaspartate(D-aspartate) O-methyltransferase